MLNPAMRIDPQGLFKFTPSWFVIEEISSLENLSKAMGKKNIEHMDLLQKASLGEITVVQGPLESIQSPSLFAQFIVL